MIHNKKPFRGYIFYQIEENGNTFKIKVPILDITHAELAEIFTDFLRGAGFAFDSLSSYQLVSKQAKDGE